MKPAQVRQILQEEGLKYWNLFLDHPVRPWEVVICQTEFKLRDFD